MEWWQMKIMFDAMDLYIREIISIHVQVWCSVTVSQDFFISFHCCVERSLAAFPIFPRKICVVKINKEGKLSREKKGRELAWKRASVKQTACKQFYRHETFDYVWAMVRINENFYSFTFYEIRQDTFFAYLYTNTLAEVCCCFAFKRLKCRREKPLSVKCYALCLYAEASTQKKKNKNFLAFRHTLNKCIYDVQHHHLDCGCVLFVVDRLFFFLALCC